MAYLNTTSPALSTVNPNAPISERAIYMVTREYGYFDKYWLPKLRGASGKVTKALYRHVSFNPTKWLKAGMAIPKYTTIAADAGVSRATVTRVLHRATPQDIARWDNEELKRQMENPAYAPRPCPFTVGDFAYTYQGEWLGGYIQRFIRRIENRWRFDKLKGHSVQTSNHYDLSHILPPIPEHDGLVQIAIKDILAQDAAKLSQENEPHNADSKEDSLRDRKMNPEIEVLKTYKKDDVVRSQEERTQVTGQAASAAGTSVQIGINQASITTTYGLTSNAGQTFVSSSCPSAKPNSTAARAGAGRGGREQDAGQKFVVIDEQRQAQTLVEQDRRKDAYEVALGIEMVYGSKFPETVAKSIVRDMEIAGAPYEVMAELVYHAKQRAERDGSARELRRYYPQVARDVLGEVQRAGWDIEHVINADYERWQKVTSPQSTSSGKGRTPSTADIFNEIADRQRRQGYFS